MPEPTPPNNMTPEAKKTYTKPHLEKEASQGEKLTPKQPTPAAPGPATPPQVELSQGSVDRLAEAVSKKSGAAETLRSGAEAAAAGAALLDEAKELFGTSKPEQTTPPSRSERPPEPLSKPAPEIKESEQKMTWKQSQGILEDYAEMLAKGAKVTPKEEDIINVAVDEQRRLVAKAKAEGILDKDMKTVVSDIMDYIFADYGQNLGSGRNQNPREMLKIAVETELANRGEPGGELEGIRKSWYEGVLRQVDQRIDQEQIDLREALRMPPSLALTKELEQTEARIGVLNWGSLSQATQQRLNELAEISADWRERFGPMANDYLRAFDAMAQGQQTAGQDPVASMLERMMGGIKEGPRAEPTEELMKFLKEMEQAEDLDPYNVGLDLKRALNDGEFTREYTLAIDAWVGLLRMNKAMEDGGGRYDVIEEAVRSHNKFSGFISKPGMSRLLAADAGIAECYQKLLGELGINLSATGSYSLDSVFAKSGKEMETAMQSLIASGTDSTRVRAAYTIMRVLGAPQGIGHTEDFVVKYFIKPREDGKTPDMDKEDLSIWFEEKKIDLAEYGIDLIKFRERYATYVAGRIAHGKKCDWYDKGKGSLRDVYELGGQEQFNKALFEDNKRGALFKYWGDNKARRGMLLAVSGNRNRSSILTFAERLKNIRTEVTKADQVDWLLDESPNALSETVKRLCDESRMDKDPATIGVDPGIAAKEEAALRKVAGDLGGVGKAIGGWLDNIRHGRFNVLPKKKQ